MKILLLISFISFFSNGAVAKKSKISYLGIMYGSLHKNPSQYSSSLTMLSCGHPLKVIELQGQGENSWLKVKAGLHTGYILSKHTKKRKPICFQDKYPRFFESLNLTVTDFYFWGKLHDNYLTGQPKAEER